MIWLFRKIANRWKCFRTGHDWHYDSGTLGGDWIRCYRCHALDEYLPGTHEPAGYDYRAIHKIK